MADAQITVLDYTSVCSVDHLVDLSGLSVDETALLIDSGVLVPVDPVAAQLMFHLHYVAIANTARRLRDDFELDGHGLALALTLLKRATNAEAELASVRAQLTKLLAVER